MRFSIVIPNYNSEKTIIKLLDSIRTQTYKDYEVIIVDDMSSDNSPKMIEDYIKNKNLGGQFYQVNLASKRYNGGTRNEGVEYAIGEYILFADCDDWFYRNDCLEQISKIIDENNKPDLIRLPYTPCIKGQSGYKVNLHEKNLSELAHTVFVAPWTKCIKRELFVPFPENTLVEDVVQHIAQIDVIKTIAYCDTPIIVWNRDNPDAISADNRIYAIDSKRFSSIYRNIADLLDLRCHHDYCEHRRQERIAWYLDKVHNNLEDTIVKRA